MKAAILTITDGSNYGNRLQNYAMQTILKNMGLETETIRRKTSRNRSFGMDIIHVAKQVIKRAIGRQDTDFYLRARNKRFARFNKLIRFSNTVLSCNVAPEYLANQYDYFICGSDQIWNTRLEIIKEDIMNYLASFAKPEQKIAYAASFGTCDIPPEYKKIFNKELKQFKAIGVREHSGIALVKEACGRIDAVEVLDPTLMLSIDKWNEIAKKPEYIVNDKYIVTYFLSKKNEKLLSYIDCVAQDYRADIVNLDIEFLNDDMIDNRHHFCTSPEEFVWLIKNSTCVLTDSFHATAFSLLYHKPFTVFQRIATEAKNDMGTRIDSLLNMVNLLSFKDDICNPSRRPIEYDGEKVDLALEIKRKHSSVFLKEALE